MEHTWLQVLRVWAGFASRCVFCARYGHGVLVWHLGLFTHWPCGIDTQGVRVEIEPQRMTLTQVGHGVSGLGENLRVEVPSSLSESQVLEGPFLKEGACVLLVPTLARS